jgi:hypothetical protein
MTKPLIREHNIATNEIIDREMTDEEFSQYEKDQAEAKSKREREIEAETKRKSALAKLSALGLETDDLKALGL